MIKTIRKIKKSLELMVGSVIPTKTRRGIIIGKNMYGNIYINRRLHGLSDEEEFYKVLDLKGRVVLELGGNLGFYTLFFSDAVGINGKVYTFEANPLVYKLLKKNIGANGCKNVNVYGFGIGNKNSKVKFVAKKFIMETGSFDTTIQEKLKTDKFGYNEWDIELKTIDSLMNSILTDKINFIKIDIEGMEIEALEGALQLLSRDLPDIYIEIHGRDNETKIRKLSRIIELLKNIKNDYKGIHLPDCISPEEIINEKINIDYTERTKEYTYDNYAFFFSTNNDFSSFKEKFSGKRHWRIR